MIQSDFMMIGAIYLLPSDNLFCPLAKETLKCSKKSMVFTVFTVELAAVLCVCMCVCVHAPPRRNEEEVMRFWKVSRVQRGGDSSKSGAPANLPCCVSMSPCHRHPGGPGGKPVKSSGWVTEERPLLVPASYPLDPHPAAESQLKSSWWELTACLPERLWTCC